MKKTFFVVATILGTLVAPAGLNINQVLAAPTTYEIDPSHSRIGFKVGHLAISTVRGNFNDFSGEFTFDEGDLSKSHAEVAIKVPSINTANEKRDQHLRSEDFFNTTKFPDIKFSAKKLEKIADNQYKLTGDLTILETTKPVTLDVEFSGKAVDMYGKERMAFSGSTKINRKDYGVTWSKTLDSGALVVGNEVSIEIEVEGVKKG